MRASPLPLLSVRPPNIDVIAAARSVSLHALATSISRFIGWTSGSRLLMATRPATVQAAESQTPAGILLAHTTLTAGEEMCCSCERAVTAFITGWLDVSG